MLDGRYLVAFGGPPDDTAVAGLAAAGRLRWLYRQLGLVEVDATEPDALARVSGVVGVTAAWKTVGATRGLAVGLNALCAFAANQATNPDAYYRHPAGIGYPVLVAGHGDRQQVDLDSSLDLPTPPALIPVVNMSLGTTTVEFPTALNDLPNLATGAASSQVLVVVAAGNCGQRPGDTMSAWARPDWVMSVGATDDAEGTRLAPYSSRGDPGPDLVAHGQSDLNPKMRRTSFAAPRVTHLARVVVAALCQLGSELAVARGNERVGVPAIGRGIIDDFGDEIWWQPASATAFMALPLLGVRPDVVSAMVDTGAAELSVRTTPAVVRDVLLTAARPVPGATSSEVGAGFVDLDLIVARLGALTAADLWGWFGPRDVAVDDRARDLRPFDTVGLHTLAAVVALTGPLVKFDYKDRTLGFSPAARRAGPRAESRRMACRPHRDKDVAVLDGRRSHAGAA